MAIDPKDALPPVSGDGADHGGTTMGGVGADRHVHGPFRPEPPAHGPARWLRAVAGVREDVLDFAPEERPRYSRLGAIIINTALLAGMSMFAALGGVTQIAWVLVPVCLFWAFVIMTFDGWLIASTHGALHTTRLWALVPRLVISILIGIVIAEPLLLLVFRPAIQKEVLDQRRAELSAYASQWQLCNPTSGEVVTRAECDDFQLASLKPPQARQTQLDQIRAQRDALKTQVDKINSQLNEKEKLARDECAGTPGPGTTGVRGQGPECKRNKAMADQYRQDSQLDQRQADLTALDQQVVVLTGQVQQASQDYVKANGAAIAALVDAKRADEGAIGLLDQDAALGRLSDHSGFVLAGQWLVRLLLIVIDCLPVLAKLLGGTTTYDRLVRKQLDLGQRLHESYLDVQERRNADNSRADVERFDEADRIARARQQAAQRDEIDTLAERLYRRDLNDQRRARPVFPGQRRQS